MHGVPKYATFEGLKILATWPTDIHGQRVKTLKPRFYAEPMHVHKTMDMWFCGS